MNKYFGFSDINHMANPDKFVNGGGIKIFAEEVVKEKFGANLEELDEIFELFVKGKNLGFLEATEVFVREIINRKNLGSELQTRLFEFFKYRIAACLHAEKKLSEVIFKNAEERFNEAMIGLPGGKQEKPEIKPKKLHWTSIEDSLPRGDR